MCGRIADAFAAERASAAATAPPPPELYLLDICSEPSLGADEAVTDVTAPAGNDWAALPPVLNEGVDAALATFVLSAVPPSLHGRALRGICRTLAPGGLLCFRDYCLYDAAQLRASPSSVISAQAHVRGDGTLAYYFTEGELRELLEGSGFQVLELKTATVRQRNRALGTEALRLFVHATAVKR